MSTPDWTNSELDHEFHVYMVDPIDHDSTLGELEVYADGASITWSKSDDGIGVTASVEVPDWTKWIDNTWLRIIHRIPSHNYERVLGTFIVWDEGASGGLDTYTGSPELVSVFRGLEYDLMPYILGIGKGASLKNVIARVMGQTPIQYRLSGFKDYRFNEPYIFDVGESRLEVLRQLCSLSGNDIWPDSDGLVRISAKQYGYSAMPIYAIDCDAERSIVYEGSVHSFSDSRQVAGRSIAVWNGREEDGAESISGYMDVRSKHFASPQRRGYIVAELHELEDLPDPKSLRHVQDLASRWLVEDTQVSKGWDIETVWLPFIAGDFIEFKPPGQDFRTCMIESITANLGSWTTSMSLREV